MKEFDKTKFEKWFKKLDLPVWYRELSTIQIEAIDSLQRNLTNDIYDGTICHCKLVLKKLSLYPEPNNKNIKNAMRLSKGDDIQFLFYLMTLYYSDIKYDYVKLEYNINEQILMSAIAHLEMVPIIHELDKKLPRGGTIKKINPTKNINLKNRHNRKNDEKKSYVSPYLEPFNIRKFEKPPKPHVLIQPPPYMENFEKYEESYFKNLRLKEWIIQNKENHIRRDRDEVGGVIVKKILSDIINKVTMKNLQNCDFSMIFCRKHKNEKIYQESMKRNLRVIIAENLRQKFGYKYDRKQLRENLRLHLQEMAKEEREKGLNEYRKHKVMQDLILSTLDRNRNKCFIEENEEEENKEEEIEEKENEKNDEMIKKTKNEKDDNMMKKTKNEKDDEKPNIITKYKKLCQKSINQNENLQEQNLEEEGEEEGEKEEEEDEELNKKNTNKINYYNFEMDYKLKSDHEKYFYPPSHGGTSWKLDYVKIYGRQKRLCNRTKQDIKDLVNKKYKNCLEEIKEDFQVKKLRSYIPSINSTNKNNDDNDKYEEQNYKNTAFFKLKEKKLIKTLLSAGIREISIEHPQIISTTFEGIHKIPYLIKWSNIRYGIPFLPRNYNYAEETRQQFNFILKEKMDDHLKDLHLCGLPSSTTYDQCQRVKPKITAMVNRLLHNLKVSHLNDVQTYWPAIYPYSKDFFYSNFAYSENKIYFRKPYRML